MLHDAPLMPLLPLAGAVLLILFGKRFGDPLAGWLGTAAVGGAFVAMLVTFVQLLHHSGSRELTENLFTWISVGGIAGHGGLHANVAFLIDPLSMTMAFFVTGVSLLIHLYSIEYMRGDKDFAKFFIYLNLFVASMLLLVLGDNLLLTFVGWEGVGCCSYWLVSFWFERDSAATAGKKAFIFNRIGDAGFLIAAFLIFSETGHLDYLGIFANLGHMSHGAVIAAALLLFFGATGKSAQIPLFTWLPDAMEGPTPVSALIHAATMVTAGVYLMVRVGPLLHIAPVVGTVIAVVGMATAFVAATIACTQDDIKKVLAFSTVSQLGFMFAAVGVGAYEAAIFLMVAHAFYKALLFLGAGSVIHGLGDEQDLKRMGNLRKYMKFTYATYVVGWLSIAGVPPFVGFWAKGDDLLNVFAKDPVLWAIAVITALLTAYYMSRQVFLAFFGDDRWREAQGPSTHHTHAHGEPHEPSWLMKTPLAILAVAALGGGLLDLPGLHWEPLHWLRTVFGNTAFEPHESGIAQWVLGAGDAVIAVVGLGIAWSLWGKRWNRPELEPSFLKRVWRVDDLYDAVIGKPGALVALGFAYVVESKVIDGAVNGVAGLVQKTGSGLRHVQTGFVRNYALGIVIGLVAIFAFMLTRAGGL